jgi:SAM-dependent methyltransferase
MSRYENPTRAGVESPADETRFDTIAAYVSANLDRRARVLEIGCSTGGLLRRVRDAGFDQVTGLDPSPGCAAAAKRLYGLNVEVGTLFDHRLPAESFDAVVLIAVLEHVADIAGGLRQLRNLVPVGGKLVIEVPDARKLADFADAPYQQFNVEHVTYFSALSLDNLMRQQGFAVDVPATAADRGPASSPNPIVIGVYRRTDAPAGELVPDRETTEYIRQYLAISAERDARIKADLAAKLKDGQPILVWGVGTLTLRLLRSEPLAQTKVVAFVDSNPRSQGRRVGGVPIIPPSRIHEFDAPILVSSLGFQDEIIRQIRHDLGSDRPVLTVSNGLA